MNLCVVLNSMERCWPCWSTIRIISLFRRLDNRKQKKGHRACEFGHTVLKKKRKECFSDARDRNEKLEFTECDITLVRNHLGWDLLTSVCVNLKTLISFVQAHISVPTVHFMSVPFRFVLISVLCNVKRRTCSFCDFPSRWNFLFLFDTWSSFSWRRCER